MKKLLLFVTMAASLLFTQCKKEESVSSAGKTVRMTVTAGPGSKTDITPTGAITWSTGDKLYVGDGSKYIGYLTLVGDGGSVTGVFSGNVTLTYEAEVDYEETEVEEEELGKGDGQTFHFFYLGSAKDYSGELSKGTSTSVDVEFDDQTGLLGDLGSCHVGYGSATGTVVGNVVTDINVTMLSKVAIARFSFKKGDAAYTDGLTLSGDNICNKMTVKFNSTEFACEGTKGDISLTDATSSEKYVMLVPTNSTTTSQTLTFADANVSGSYILENGIEANKFYGLTGAIEVTLAAAGPAHETVNFGTPNLNWSKYNLGVDPSNLSTAADWYGDYYAWGETAPYYQNGDWCAHPSHNSNITFDNTVGYKWKNYLDGTSTSWVGSLDWKPYGNGTTLTSEYDAATVVWGEGWRMPTQDEWQKLYNNNTFEWLNTGSTSTNVTSFKAIAAGYLVVKGGKNSIALDASVYMFLPAAGYRNGTGVNGAGSYGIYWSSSLLSAGPSNACSMYFDSGNVNPQNGSTRYNGCSVRPVQ